MHHIGPLPLLLMMIIILMMMCAVFVFAVVSCLSGRSLSCVHPTGSKEGTNPPCGGRTWRWVKKERDHGETSTNQPSAVK